MPAALGIASGFPGSGLPGAAVYVAITNHGFGHATRTAAVLAELLRCWSSRFPQRPLRLTLVTRAPRWLLEAYLPGVEFDYRPRVLDVGVVQGDSRTMDKAATLAQLGAIRARQAEIVAEESRFIRDQGIGLVLGDIPPLAATIARAAGVPCWMASNFGWDHIYRGWDGFDSICRWIEDCFGQCDRLFRLPFHEPMAAFGQIEDVGLTGGNPSYDAAMLRQRLRLNAPKERTLLLTFGGLGIDNIPYDGLRAFPDWQFLSLDRDLPDLPNLCRVDGVSYRPVDLMLLCDRILVKPGYGTFSEACRQNVGLMTLNRQGFAETPLLLDGIQSQLPHRILSDGAFFRGDWAFLHEALVPAKAGAKFRHDGNQVIAQAIADYLSVS